MPKRYKGVIFDFNGVLIDDGHLQELSWQKVLSKITKKNIPLKKITSFIQGRCVKEIFETYLKRKLSHEELKFLSNEKERYYRALCLANKEHFSLTKGVENFLNWLKNTEIPIGIATSAGKDNMDFYFKYLNLSLWFNRNVIIYDDGTIKCKPAPDPYILASKKLRLEPSEVIAIENSTDGIKSAKAAKIGYIIAVCSERQPDKFIKKNANLIINSFEDLMFKLKEESR